MIETHGDAHLHARRLVAQQCLYGVDKNAAAVELAKLSLWLVTLSRTLPFTFVDHALRHGDSLVGLDFKQIQSFHWSPAPQLELVQGVLREALDQAVDLRQQILALADHDDPASQSEKRRLFEFAQQAIERVRIVADVCVGAFFAEKKDAGREKERKRRLGLVQEWLSQGEKAEEARVELEDLSTDVRKGLAPFHWWIEFPEVFFEERPDPLQGGEKNGAALMEGVVGNPPFGGKNTISDGSVEGYLDWLMATRPEVVGRPNTDLCAYFFRRAADIIGPHGALGLVATNTIAEGDSRLVSLRHLVEQGALIVAADTDMTWPGQAAVMVSLVHIAFGLAKGSHGAILNGDAVDGIDSRLKEGAERADAKGLTANKGLAFMGGKLVGAGLAMDISTHDELIGRDPRNATVLRPYLGGEETNSNPGGCFERYMIDFTDHSVEEAAKYPDVLQIVERKVRPARELDKRGTYRTYWWKPGESGGSLYAAVKGQKQCLVAANVTKHLMFSFKPTSWFFSNTLYVFAFEDRSQFATLQSRIHEPWARLLSSSLEDRLRYAASDCFETFPFPQPDPRTVIPSLEAIGERLYETRARFMVETNQGLTKTYNALKDPSCDDPRVLELRRLHEEMDRAVLEAYGWGDVVVPPYCPLDEAGKAAVAAFEDEVVDRLYVLNAERAREEERLGLAGKKAKGKGKGKKGGGEAPEGQGSLFS